MDIYDLMLEELEKGNALYVEVDDLDTGEVFERFRLVTPSNCEFSVTSWCDGQISRSCFLWDHDNLSTKKIIEKMRAFDKRCQFLISTFTVL